MPHSGVKKIPKPDSWSPICFFPLSAVSPSHSPCCHLTEGLGGHLCVCLCLPFPFCPESLDLWWKFLESFNSHTSMLSQTLSGLNFYCTLNGLLLHEKTYLLDFQCLSVCIWLLLLHYNQFRAFVHFFLYTWKYICPTFSSPPPAIPNWALSLDDCSKDTSGDLSWTPRTKSGAHIIHCPVFVVTLDIYISFY